MEGEKKELRRVDLKDIFKNTEKIKIEGDNGYFECYLKKLNPIEKQEINEISSRLLKEIKKEILEKEDTQVIFKQLEYLTKEEILGLLFQRDDLVSKEWIMDTLKVEGKTDNEEELKEKRYSEIVNKKRELLEKKDIEELKSKFKEDIINNLTTIEISNRLGNHLLYYMVYECKDNGEIGGRYFKSIDDPELKYLDDAIRNKLHSEINKFSSSISQIQLKNLQTTQ